MIGCCLDLAPRRLLHLESMDIKARLWSRTFPEDDDKRGVVRSAMLNEGREKSKVNQINYENAAWGCLAGSRVFESECCAIECWTGDSRLA